jgi:hypothetical protein
MLHSPGMSKNQVRAGGGARARPYPVSIYQATIDDLNSIKRSTGESHGAIVRRLVEKEIQRLHRKGVATWEVLTFPSYQADAPPMETLVIYRDASTEEEVIRAVGYRLLPTPPEGSLVLVRRSGLLGNLHGKLVQAEVDESGEPPTMTLLVDALPARAIHEPERRAAYLNWIEAVFEAVGAGLVATVPPSGSDRTVAAYRIAHTGPLNEDGAVGWSVLAFESPRRGQRLKPVIWHATPSNGVAQQILAAVADIAQLRRRKTEALDNMMSIPRGDPAYRPAAEQFAANAHKLDDALSEV